MASENPNLGDALATARQRLKAGRNDPCPCGSGQKYKKCCLTGDEALVREASRQLPPTPAQVPLDEPLVAEATQVLDIDPYTGPLEDNISDSLFAAHTRDVEGAPPELDQKLKQIWDQFEALPCPSLEEINAMLDQLFRLPPEATLWSEVFHTLARLQPGELPGLFRRIAENIPHTKEAGIAYFYWAAMEVFDRHGYRHLLPEIAAALRKLDIHSYNAEALSHMRDYLLTAGFDAELMAVCEYYLPILRQDEELFGWVAPNWSHLLFEIRAGRLLEADWGPDTSVESLTRSLRADIEPDTYPETASYLVETATGRAPPAAWTSQEFELTGKPVPKGKGPLAEHLRPIGALLRVAQEAKQFDQIKPGCAFPALMQLMEMVQERDDRGNKKKQARNLLDFLRASSIDSRVARHSQDLLSYNLPKARLLLQAHELLLHSTARHQLLPAMEVARTEAELARLHSYL